MFQIRFPPEISRAAKRANFVSLDNKKASGEGKTGGVVVMVVVTGCVKASGGFHHTWKEVHMRMYAREHDFSNKCMVLNGFLRVCEEKT